MNEAILTILLSWAAHYSGYDKPEELPIVEYKPHEFFVENACSGYECRVTGWYNDGGIIYLDKKFLDKDNAYISGLIVHEAVHFLQDKSSKFKNNCVNRVWREIEAYSVQNSYLKEQTTVIGLLEFPSWRVC